MTSNHRFIGRAKEKLLGDDREPLSSRLLSGGASAMRYVTGAAGGVAYLAGCSHVGLGVRVQGGRPIIENRGILSIDAHSQLYCYCAPVALRTAPEGELSIGKWCHLNFGAYLSASRRVTIGDNVSVGPYAVISDTETSDRDQGATRAAPIFIGNRVWLAARVTVLPGVTIGEGSVITAGSVVRGDIPPGVVAGGIPARVLRRISESEQAAPQAIAETSGTSDTHEPAEPENSGPRSQEQPAPAAYQGKLVSDFTIDGLARYLNDADQRPLLDFDVAPYGQVVQSLLEQARGQRVDEVVVVWTLPHIAVPSFAKVLAYETLDGQEWSSEVDAFAQLIKDAAKHARAVIVPTWTVPSYHRGRGLADARPGGVMRVLTAMNLRLMEQCEGVDNVFVLNGQRWVERAGARAHSPKLWHLGKVPFHEAVFEEAAADVRSAIACLSGKSRKLLIVDLDDTLWGGIVGDVGWENLSLGGHDAAGEAFVEFQRCLKALKRRGVLLAIVSKNEESVALDALRSHPEMILREQDFVGWRINWNDKAKNVAELTAALKLGLEAVVFIDDNPVERARVRDALPEVFVPEWPEDKLLYASSLAALNCFDVLQLSREDLERTELYAAEQQRESFKQNLTSLDDWLVGLATVVRSSALGPANLNRAAQLLNKTNQMNLATRRLTVNELERWAVESHRVFNVVHVSDRFGDAGLTGIISLELSNGVARIVDFLLSCRVMGRKVEETLLHLAVSLARERGAREVVADFIATAKNKPCLDFWKRSGFTEHGHSFRWDTAAPYACPGAIRLVREA